MGQYLSPDSASSMKVCPVVIDELLKKTNMAENHTVLASMESGMVVKAYKDGEGYYLFPDGNNTDAILIPHTENLQAEWDSDDVFIKVTEITNENIVDLSLTDEQMERAEIIFENDVMEDNVNRLSKDVYELISTKPNTGTRYNGPIISGRAQEGEIHAVYRALKEIDPIILRGLVDVGKFCSMRINNATGIDGMIFDILRDKEMAKGAAVAGAINNLYTYSKSESQAEGSVAIFKAALFILHEIGRQNY